MKKNEQSDKINKFFVELFGGCYHEWHADRTADQIEDLTEGSCVSLVCSNCRAEVAPDRVKNNPDFFTEKGFFKLLKFAKEQSFWSAFASQLSTGIYYNNACSTNLPLYAIDEEVFSVELHKFLTENPGVLKKNFS